MRINLIAPPSRTDLGLSGLSVQVKIGQFNNVLTLSTNQAGEVVIPSVPDGYISIAASTTLQNIDYRAEAALNINGNIRISATLRSSGDADAFVAPFTTAPSRTNSLQTTSAQFFRNAVLRKSQATSSSLAVGPSLGGGSNPMVQTGSSSSGAQFDLPSWYPGQNEAYSRFQIAQGTPVITYIYHLLSGTCESSTWPPSDDEWTLSIDAGGKKIFEKTGDIKSYCSYYYGGGLPVTGTVDVSALTASSPIWITIRGRLFDSVVVDDINGISNRHLMTGKVAPSNGQIVITSVTHDDINTRNDGTYYSLPRPSAANILQRTFTLNVLKTAGVSLLNARVNILTPSGTSLFQPLNASSSQPGFEIVEETSTTAVVRLRSTVLDPLSTIAGTPPPLSKFYYLFSLSGKLGTKSVSGSYRLIDRNALWVGPDAVVSKSYGAREAGGDKWTSRETYSWLSSNASLVREIGDISGEHGKDIGHQAHATGNDIDMFHFYKFPGVTTGPGGATLNYTKLAEDVAAALGTLVAAPASPPASAVASKQRVVEWINASRTGLTALAALAPVQTLYYCDGEAVGTTLPNGWCRSLLVNGKLKYVNGSEVVFVSSAYANTKLETNDIHNNHIHITIDPAKVTVQN